MTKWIFDYRITWESCTRCVYIYIYIYIRHTTYVTIRQKAQFVNWLRRVRTWWALTGPYYYVTFTLRHTPRLDRDQNCYFRKVFSYRSRKISGRCHWPGRRGFVVFREHEHFRPERWETFSTKREKSKYDNLRFSDLINSSLYYYTQVTFLN